MDKGRSIKTNLEYLEYVNKGGTIRDLCYLVSRGKGIEESEVIFKLPAVLPQLTTKQEKVARRYYLQQDTVFNIRHEFKFSSYRAVDKYLDSIVTKIIKKI